MSKEPHPYQSLSEVHQSIDTTSSKRKGWRKALAFLGPAYLVSVGYMDPGNWATDLAGGSRYGYTLIWVLLMSNAMALLLQSLSARLGIVRGRDLAQANYEAYPKYINLGLYVLAEIAIAATDLAEILGMAIGLQLLTGIPLIWGVSITVLDTFLLLLLQRLGMRRMEAFIIALVFIIGMSFLIEILLAKPDYSEVAAGFIPHIPDNTALYIAIGIIGATVMPHNLYLHSALVQTRKIERNESGIKRALKLNFVDSAIALNLAFFVNAAILILAATVFFKSGRTDVAEIKEAHKLLAPMLGTHLAPVLFAIALIAAGQSSTVTGTLAGQIVMEGYLHLRINPWVRRLLTRLIAIIPAIIVILINGEKSIDNLLVFSQVILSLQLGFAIIPLIHFVSDKKTMGTFAIKPWVQALSWIITLVLVYLNIRMVTTEVLDFFNEPGHLFSKVLIILGSIAFAYLFLVTFFHPLLKKKKWKETPTTPLHSQAGESQVYTIPDYKKIALALDFSENDRTLIAHAISQGKASTSFVLIHVVESVAARVYQEQSDDLESRADQSQLNVYVQELQQLGYHAEARLGFGKRAQEIVRAVKESGADMLVIGAHRHSGILDWIYGETIESVRHDLHIPVLIVNV